MGNGFELDVDSDWKAQAREEKRKLAEEASKRTPPPGASSAAAAPPAGATRRRGRGRARGVRDHEGPADFASLVRTFSDNVVLYLGLIPVTPDGQGMLDLDAAKRQIDLLAVLEQKAGKHLSAEERSTLDVALYESRSRFSSVASRYVL